MDSNDRFVCIFFEFVFYVIVIKALLPRPSGSWLESMVTSKMKFYLQDITRV